jgi:hypothetical protein
MNQDGIWQFFIIRAVTVRSSINHPWKIIWLVIIPKRVEQTRCDLLLDNSTIKFIEEVVSLDTIDNFLIGLFTEGKVKIGDIEGSTDLLRYEPETKDVDRYESKSLTGIEFPGQLLFVKGPDPQSDIVSSLKNTADNALLINDPPFENIEDAIDEIYGVNPRGFNNQHLDLRNGFRPLLMVLHPDPVHVVTATIVNSDLIIETFLSSGIDPTDIKLSIIGRMRKKSIRKTINLNDAQIKEEIPTTTKIAIGEEPGPLNVRLFFKGQSMDLVHLTRRGPSIQGPNWFKTIMTRIDPDYEALESWIVAKGKSIAADDFERGVTMLFSLCGLNVIHVGGGYEKATLNARRRLFANPNTASDILIWSPDSVYICQCSLGKDPINDKIEKLVTFMTELNKVTLISYEQKPKVNPVIISNVDAQLLLRTDRTNAENKGIKIITKDDLVQLLSRIKNNDVITQNELHSILTVERSINESPDNFI